MTRYAGIGVALAVLVLVGCGSSSAPPPAKALTHAQLIRDASHACSRFAQRIKDLRSTPHDFVRNERIERTIVIPAFEHLIFTLHGLAPPPTDAAVYRKMLSNLNFLDLRVQQFYDQLDLVAANQDRSRLARAKTFLRRIKRVDQRVKAETKTLGLTVCANS